MLCIVDSIFNIGVLTTDISDSIRSFNSYLMEIISTKLGNKNILYCKDFEYYTSNWIALAPSGTIDFLNYAYGRNHRRRPIIIIYI